MELPAKIELRFRLQLDRDDVRVGDVTRGYFNAASTVKDLEENIHAAFHHGDSAYRAVFVKRDGNLTALDAPGKTPLKEAGVKDGDTIVVKHVMLEEWEQYLERVNTLATISEKEIRGGSISKSKTERDLRERLLKIAGEAAGYFETLEQTRFFSAYIDFIRIRDENVNRTGFLLLHVEENWFKKAVKAYFEKERLLKHPQASMTCAMVTDAGMQTACLVKLESDGKSIAQYYAKFMAGMKPGLSLKSKDLQSSIFDLREIFVYRLLSLIKVGSEEVHVIRDAAESGYVYLATKIIHGFWTRDGRSVDATMQGEGKDEKKWGTIDEASRKVMEAQLEILVWLLGLKDLGVDNEANYGYVETQIPEGGLAYELKIVDFTVGPEKKACKKEHRQRFNEYVTTRKIDVNIKEALDQMRRDPAIEKKFEKDDKAGQTEEAVRLDEYIKYIENHIHEVAETKGSETLKRKTASEGEGKNEKKEKKEDGGN